MCHLKHIEVPLLHVNIVFSSLGCVSDILEAFSVLYMILRKTRMALESLRRLSNFEIFANHVWVPPTLGHFSLTHCDLSSSPSDLYIAHQKFTPFLNPPSCRLAPVGPVSVLVHITKSKGGLPCRSSQILSIFEPQASRPHEINIGRELAAASRLWIAVVYLEALRFKARV